MSRSPLAFLQDARHYAERARTFAGVDCNTFVSCGAPVEAMYHLIVVGEALRNIPDRIRSLSAEIPW